MGTIRRGGTTCAAALAAVLVAAPGALDVRAADEAPLAPTAVWECGYSPQGLSVSGDGKLVVAARFLSTPIVLDASSGKKVREILGGERSYQTVEFTGGERAILVAAGRGADGPPLLLDAATGRKRGSLAQRPGAPREFAGASFISLAVPRDGGLVFAHRLNDTHVSLHDAETGEFSSALEISAADHLDPHATRFERMACSADGRSLALMLSAGGRGTRLVTYRVQEMGKRVGRRFECGLGTVEGGSPFADSWLTDDGEVFVTGGAPPPDAPVRSASALIAWRTDTGARLWSRPVADLADADTSGKLLARTVDHAVEVLEVATGRTIHRLEAGAEWKPVAVAFAPGTARLFAGSNDGKLAVFDLPPAANSAAKRLAVRSLATTEVVARPGSPVSCIAVAPDDSLLAIGCEDGKVRVVDAATRKETRVLAGHKSAVRFVAFLGGDPAWLASMSGDRLRVWNPATGYLRKDIVVAKDVLPERVPGFAASPKGHVLAYCTRSGNLTIWDGDGAVHEWEGTLFDTPRLLAWSPDGASIACTDFGYMDFEDGMYFVEGYGVFDVRTKKPVWMRHRSYAALTVEDEADRGHAWVAARFTPNGERFIRLINDRYKPKSREMGGSIRSSAAATGVPQWETYLPGNEVREVIFRSDGRALLLTERGPYDLQTRTGGAEPATDLPDAFLCAAFAPRSGLLYLALYDGTIVSAKRPR